MGAFKVMGNNETHRVSTSYISTNDKFIPYLLSSLLTTLIVIFVFKSGQNDGTDLLVASKPITRGQVIFGKFLITLLLMTGIQIFIFLVTIVYIQFDHYSFGNDKATYALAISAGGLIIQFIFSSFIILLSLFVSRVGILVISIIGSVTIPIVSMIIIPISKARPWSVRRFNSVYTSSFFVEKNPLDNMEKNFEDIYSDSNTLPILAEGHKGKIRSLDKKLEINRKPDGKLLFMIPRLSDLTSIRNSKKFFSERWYKEAAPFDIWYQWSSFADSINNNTSTGIFDYYFGKKTINLHTNYSMNPNGNDIFSKIFLFMNRNTKNSNDASISKINNDYKEAISGTKYVSVAENKHVLISEVFRNSNFSFTSRINALEQLENRKYEHVGLSYRTYFVYRKFIKYLKEQNKTSGGNSYKKPNTIFGNKNKGKEFERIGINADDTKEPNWLYVNNDVVTVWKKREYIPTSTKIWVWLSIVFGLFSTTIIIYYRKDFK